MVSMFTGLRRNRHRVHCVSISLSGPVKAATGGFQMNRWLSPDGRYAGTGARFAQTIGQPHFHRGDPDTMAKAAVFSNPAITLAREKSSSDFSRSENLLLQACGEVSPESREV
ncbi:MAG: hypothetical protein WD941_06150, partial [Opitutus sp.]